MVEAWFWRTPRPARAKTTVSSAVASLLHNTTRDDAHSDENNDDVEFASPPLKHQETIPSPTTHGTLDPILILCVLRRWPTLQAHPMLDPILHRPHCPPDGEPPPRQSLISLFCHSLPASVPVVFEAMRTLALT
nr:hypothetical protein CFP56_13097 [Quercus suber]